MFNLSDQEFDQILLEAVESLPEEFKNKLDNVEIVVEESPSPEVLKKFPKNRLLLGLYQGIPHKRRTSHYGLVLPDKICIYKRNIEMVSASKDEIRERIRRTLLHEIGHHFSLTDKDLRRLGW
ncbi:MAG: metallopeptidase family protein [bacterium]